VQRKKKELGVKLLKKIFYSKLKSYNKQINVNSIEYFLHRQKKQMIKNLTLFKALNMLGDKLKTHKFQALGRIKESILFGISQNQSMVTDEADSFVQHVSELNSVNIIQGMSQIYEKQQDK
jgi:hypothetical protein